MSIVIFLNSVVTDLDRSVTPDNEIEQLETAQLTCFFYQKTDIVEQASKVPVSNASSNSQSYVKQVPIKSTPD